jgi:rhamnulokinase
MATRVGAIDLGATSIRVAVIDLDDDSPTVEVVHRWHHGPESRPDGSVRWRWGELLDNVRLGLDLALSQAPLASIGVDGWAVDYGLLDEDDRLLSDPHSYRSPRTAKWRDVVDVLGEPELYRRTGIQLMPINTIFQLAAHDRAELARARRLVMLPELVAHALTGAVAAERSNAGTTGLLELATDDWATDLCAAVGVDSAILPPPEAGVRVLGEYLGTPVHLVAAHDTAYEPRRPCAPGKGTARP